MAQKKAHEVEAWTARPQEAFPIVLLYGPDRGLVSERATRLMRGWGFALDDPFSVTRMDASEIEQDPGRLVDEAQTIAMFADRRLIWVKGVGAHKALATVVKDLCAKPPAATIVLLEGGDLKKASPVRTAVEAGSAGMALPCYQDQAKALDAVIDEVMGAAGLAIEPEARQLLKAALGGDRLASRGEVEKLALYAHGASRIDTVMVRDIVGDASGQSLDAIVDAVLRGNVAALDDGFRSWTDSGNAAFLVLAALQRQLQQLELLRAAVDAGATPEAVVSSARPPVFFSRRSIIERALQADARTMSHCLDRLQAATLASRVNGRLEQSTVRQTLLATAMEFGRRR